MNNAISLYELNNLVRSIIEGAVDEVYWVHGELVEGRVGSGGHFYGELVHKNDAGQIIARARITIWARTYNLLSRRFEQETGESLRAGLHVMLCVRVTFHEQYGYSLEVRDVDSSFTLGDMVRRRKEIIAQLQADGIADDNKQLPLPRLLTRIAVVSAAGAAGYGDFCDQLHNNDYQLRFTTQLFPAVMQGKHVEESVIAALEAIADEYDQWDAVVIIRGGGATTDLSDFDSYPLAACVAMFPLPVIVGIGHDRDETVLDYIAHTRVKTPTAAAAFLIEHQAEELAVLQALQRDIFSFAREHVHCEQMRLQRTSSRILQLFSQVRQQQSFRMQLLYERMLHAVPLRMERERNRLSRLSQQVESLDPNRLLRLGYSITTCNGAIVRSASDLKTGDRLVTRFSEGSAESVVQ